MSLNRRTPRRQASLVPFNNYEEENASANIENVSNNMKSTRRSTRGQKIDEDYIPKTPTSSRKDTRRKITEDSDSSPEEVNEVSPSKQVKFQKNRPATVDSHIFSPSRLLTKLNIKDSPGNFKESIKSDATSPKVTNKKNKYQNAKRVLNSAETDLLPGREKELEELSCFFTEHLSCSTSGSLYVSGPPGTGKTACLSKLLKSKEYIGKFFQVYVNCTSIKTCGSIYKKICSELNLKEGKTEKENLKEIEKFLARQHKMILLVLDEIDELSGPKQTVLYTIFEWPSRINSNIILVGIANSLDLTDRLLVRLNARCELKPKLMHFAPYSKQQIIEIFKSRLEEAGVLDIFPPVTIQLLSGKVAAVSGDVRRALDIGRRVVAIAEKEKRSKSKKITINYDDLGLELLEDDDKSTEDEKLQPVEVKQVVDVLNQVYGTAQKLNDDTEDDFPIHQKILICCLLLMLRKEKNKDITIRRLQDVYRKVCTKRNIVPVDGTEFSYLCSLVESRGIIRIVGKREPQLNKIMLQWDEDEVNGALKDKQLISSILSDFETLGK